MKLFINILLIIFFLCNCKVPTPKKTEPNSITQNPENFRRVLLLIEPHKNDKNSKLFSIFLRSSFENLFSSEKIEFITREEYEFNKSILEERKGKFTLQDIESDTFKILQPDKVVLIKFKLDEDIINIQFLVTSLNESESIEKIEKVYTKKDINKIPELIGKLVQFKSVASSEVIDYDSTFFDLFIKADDLFDNKDFSKSAQAYNQLILDLNSKNKNNTFIYNLILFKLGVSYYEIKNYTLSEETFKLCSKYIDTRNLSHFDLNGSLTFYTSLLFFYHKNDINNSIKNLLLSKKIKESNNSNNTFIYINILDRLSNFYRINKNNLNANEINLKVLDQLSELELLETLSYSDIIFSIGLFEIEQGNFTKAQSIIESAKKAKENFKDNKNQKFAEILTNLGYIYMNLDQLGNGIQNFQRAKALLESLNLTGTEGYSFVLMNMGIIYIQEEKYAEAYRFLKLAEKNYKSMNLQNTLEYSIVLSQLGILEERNNNIDTALVYYKSSQSIRVHLQLEETDLYAETNILIGNLYKESKKDACQSISFFTKSIEIFKKLDNKNQEKIASQELLEAKSLCK
jgi:hypothetical protein